MKLQVCLILSVCVLQVIFVEPLVIDKIKLGATKARQDIKCGLHKFGNLFVSHDHAMDPCQEPQKTQEPDNEIDPGVTEITIDVRGQEESNSTDLDEKGRRLIFAGSNCPSGHRMDKQGRCREEY